MNTAAPPRPRPARLGSRELQAYVEAALPYALVVDRNGVTWAVNRVFQPLSRRSKADPNRWVSPDVPGAPPRPVRPDVMAIIPLYDDASPPWDAYSTLHAIENLWARWRPETIGRAVNKADRRTRGEPEQVADTAGFELA